MANQNPINDAGGIDTPAQFVSEWVADETTFSAPKSGILTLQVNPDLVERKIYVFGNQQTQGSISPGAEYYVDGEAKFFLNGTQVGKFPISYGWSNQSPPVRYLKTRATIGSAVVVGNPVASQVPVATPQACPDGIYINPIMWTAGAPTLTAAVLVAPQNFRGRFDTIRFDVSDMYNTGLNFLWLGCLSGPSVNQVK